MLLKTIPLDMNGWSVYCDFSNNAGHTQTEKAKLTVTAKGAAVQNEGSAQPVIPAAATPAPAAASVDVPATATAATPYTGTYTIPKSSQATILVTETNNVYTIEIDWSGKAAELYHWKLTGTINNGVLEYTDATKVLREYDLSGNKKDTVMFTDGTGRVIFANGGLTWTDYKEKTADGLYFERLG